MKPKSWGRPTACCLTSLVLRVLDLHPGHAAARAIAAVPALRDDPLKPETAGVLEHRRAVVLVGVLGKVDQLGGTREEAGKPGVAFTERQAAEVQAVQLQ